MNKQNTIEEYQKELTVSSSIEKVEIVKEIVLTELEYDEVSNSLLSDDKRWEKIGGRKNTKGVEFSFSFSDEERSAWLEDTVTVVVRVSVRNDRTNEMFNIDRYRVPFLVNTEGHTYARYVGFLVSDITN